MNLIVNRLTESYGGPNEVKSAVLTPLEEEIFGTTRPALITLLTAIGLVLLIACANVAGLLLVRGLSRQRELAIRLAMGARRVHIVSQLLSESLPLAFLGGLGGILVALWGLDILVAMTPPRGSPSRSSVHRRESSGICDNRFARDSVSLWADAGVDRIEARPERSSQRGNANRRGRLDEPAVWESPRDWRGCRHPRHLHPLAKD